MSEHRAPDLKKLKEAIQSSHECAAWHVASEPLADLVVGEAAWSGVVETFRLVGHPIAQRCYAWSFEENGETKYASVLEMPPVDSAEAAVRAAMREKAEGKRGS